LGECTWDLSNTELPYCHLEETKNIYNFENIDEWVEKIELEENVEALLQ
jgi:hypothetical protein